jgi:large subunit ribosomal protein L5
MGMKDIRIEKITVNIGCGTKYPVENAKTILERLTNSKVVITHSKKRSTFNVPKNKPIGCKTTIRRGKEEFLRRLLASVDNKLSASNFDNTGNLSFGVAEYIGVENMDYDPKIGIMGFDVCVTLERPGYRVKRRKISSKIGKGHQIKKADAMSFMKEKFGLIIEGE